MSSFNDMISRQFEDSSGMGLTHQMKIPDVWQQQAVQGLQSGCDVVVDAPAGAGKTYIFELFIKSGFRGKAIYTVPTRALANDKMLEWRSQNWDVGIATGDISENANAPVVVATLETQKRRILRGEGPNLLVIDEYQMIGDHSRGTHYELTIAQAPAHTQLLLLSGSVGNPADVVAWLRRLGRKVLLVSHKERPVPLEEAHIEGIKASIPQSVRGFWPRIVARILQADMGPLLIFAPRRREAESLARLLATALPRDLPLSLTQEQRKLAGDNLRQMLKNRVAFHHSGLSYQQRAGLVEPLAKNGQLRVVVATMGLAAGINFSLRSVMVTSREYRAHNMAQMVRPDELLQMFGRAGRRGLDARGYVIHVPGKPRLNEARAMLLKRTRRMEWPSLLGVMLAAAEKGDDPQASVEAVLRRLFTDTSIDLGFDQLEDRADHVAGNAGDTVPAGDSELPEAPPPAEETNATAPVSTPDAGGSLQYITEMQNPEGKWERMPAPVKRCLRDILFYTGKKWVPLLQCSRPMRKIGWGLLSRRNFEAGFEYGRHITLARLGKTEAEGELVLNKRLVKELLEYNQREGINKKPRAERWTLDRMEKVIVPLLPHLTGGGTLAALDEKDDAFTAFLHYRNAEVFCSLDARGRALLNPPTRETAFERIALFRGDSTSEGGSSAAVSVVTAWKRLKLIDEYGYPTRRGVICSFFNHGEGLAVAAALEDEAYDIEELVYDLANLRAGHRFSLHEQFSGRLGNACRKAYGGADYPGYLAHGVPPDYGDGAAEVILALRDNPASKRQFDSEELSMGDIERARVEWVSLLNHISRAPDMSWKRWMELKEASRQLTEKMQPRALFESLPPLTSEQCVRLFSFTSSSI